jgi:NADH dehydrogenase
MAETHRVVVVGGGFAGLNAVRALKSSPARVTLVDRRNFHLFQPLLYQVATGSLAPGEISSALRAIFSRQQNARVLLGEVRHIDPRARAITLADGERLEYDSLIVAVGSATSYFGHDAWQQYAPCLKTIEDATEMRGRIFTAFEKAELEGAQGHSPWLTFVIVGGGPTGVELAGALSEIARKTLKYDFRTINPEQAQLILVDQAPRLLPALSERLADKAERALVRLGVRVRCGVKVTDIDEDGVQIQLADGSKTQIRAKTVLWAGGVAVPAIVKELGEATGAPMSPKGHIQVLPDLTVPGHPEIFVVGDSAALKNKDGRWLPGVAQVAMQQGVYAGTVIHKRLTRQPAPQPFAYSDRGDMAVIGRAFAVAKVFGVELSGWLAWFIWLFIHLLYLVNFQSRMVVFIRWAFQYVTFQRGARLITGAEANRAAETIAMRQPREM